MERVIQLLSGPNLNMLGMREPELYGWDTIDILVTRARTRAELLGFSLEHLQSNREAGLVEAVQGLGPEIAALVINAGALSHYSWALADALAAKKMVKIELHITNTFAREAWRWSSVLAPVVDGSIQGFGAAGYEIAVMAAAQLLEERAGGAATS